jgi:ABC-type dipeptide/oligopeptide/nickel transport system permease component
MIGGMEQDPNAVAKIEFLRKEYGLDKPLIEQYALIPQDIADTVLPGWVMCGRLPVGKS